MGGTGEIVTFGDYQGQNQVEIRTAHVATGVEVIQHEEIIEEGQSSVRRRKRKPGEAEIRLRVVDNKSWKRVLMDED